MIRLKAYIISFFTGVLFLYPAGLFAQNIDSITIVVQLLIHSTNAHEQVVFTQKCDDSTIIANSLSEAGNYFHSQSDSAIRMIRKATDLSLKAKSLLHVSLSLEQMGNYYFYKENYDKATPCYLNCLQIEEKLGNEIRFATMNLNLGRIYNHMEITAKSIDFSQKALEIFQKHKDTLNIVLALRSLASINFNRNFWEQIPPEQKKENYNQSLLYYQKAEDLVNVTGDKVLRANILQGIASVYNHTGKPDKALDNLLETLSIYRSLNDPELIGDALFGLGITYDKLGNHKKALTYLNEAIEIAKKHNIGGIHWVYESLAEANYNAGNYKQSRDMYVKFINTRDSVLNLEKSKQIVEIETKYQSEKKQIEIEKLNLIKNQRTLVIYILIGTLLLILLFSYTYFRNIRNKKIIACQQLEIKKKQLLELKKERQLLAAKSVLQGEETERFRLAGDLHDGLGGLLTGVKLKLSTMKENAIITSENLEHFNRALDLLDTSINEMRRVAHNLMPETLVHYGLQTALHDFVKQVAPEGSPIVSFNTFGNDLRFSKELEITTYRITQELITNAIKHAFAKQIDVQIFTEKERICVQIIDNGIGFDPEKQESSIKGQGLKNIRDRVTAFNGRFEIISQEGKGTESTLEFFIP